MQPVKLNQTFTEFHKGVIIYFYQPNVVISGGANELAASAPQTISASSEPPGVRPAWA